MCARPNPAPSSRRFIERRPPRLLPLLLATCALLPAAPSPAGAAEPQTIVDFASVHDVGAGDPFVAWMRRMPWNVRFGGPTFFSIEKGALHLIARPGPMASSSLLWRLLKREDKVLVQLTPDGFRLQPAALRHVEVQMAPLRLPGKGADVTDSARNDACFYLLVSFDGPRHFFEGRRVADTVAYVWADGPWQTGAAVGRERKYGAFMRYIAIGRGPDRLGQLRTWVRDIDADFRQAFPERATGGVPDVVEVGLMIDSNTVKSEAESLLRSVRFLP